MVSRADILRWSRDGWERNATLQNYAGSDDLVVGYADELVGDLADRMAAKEAGRVPIVDRATGRLVGLVGSATQPARRRRMKDEG